MIPFEVYRTYLSVRNHFTRDSYDFFRFGGKTKVSSGAFDRRKDRYIFDKISKDFTQVSLQTPTGLFVTKGKCELVWNSVG